MPGRAVSPPTAELRRVTVCAGRARPLVGVTDAQAGPGGDGISRASWLEGTGRWPLRGVDAVTSRSRHKARQRAARRPGSRAGTRFARYTTRSGCTAMPPEGLARTCKRYMNTRPQLAANGRETGQPTPFYRGRLRSAQFACSLRSLLPQGSGGSNPLFRTVGSASEPSLCNGSLVCFELLDR